MSPFLALRDYGGHEGQWGSEPDPASFLDHLLELAGELRRVLAPHGSIAIELGDTFAGSGGAGGDYQQAGMRDGQRPFTGSAKTARIAPDTTGGRRAAPITDLTSRVNPGGPGWPRPKSLCGTPTLFAWSLAYGRNLLRPDHTIDPWLVRNMIVWARNNPPVGALGDKVAASAGRAADPVDVPRPGVPHLRRTTAADHRASRVCEADFPSGTLATGNRRRVTGHDNGNMARVATTLGWSDCGHGDNWRPGHVLDTFAGTGTTLAVADILGRDATGIDLDPANPGLYPARWEQCWKALRPDAGPAPITTAGQQLGLAL